MVFSLISKLNADNNVNAVRTEATTPRKFLAMATFVIRKMVGGDRFGRLTDAVSTTLSGINEQLGHKARLLDYGCGSLSVGKSIAARGLTSEIVAVDKYDIADAVLPPGIKFQQIDGEKLNFPDASFDAAIILDVLHHADIENAVEILKEVARCSRFIVVKDHLEYGFFSRHMLRLADWFGNAAYGVDIPKRYFSTDTWQQIITKAGLKELDLKVGVRIYDGLFGVLLPPHYHFISVLTRA